MRKFQILLVLFLISTTIFGQVGINTDKPNINAGLHVSERMDPATTGAPDKYNGTIIQRYSTAERATFTLGAADNGFTIYNKTENCYNVWTWNAGISTGSWVSLCGDKQGMVDFTDCSSIRVIGKYIIDKPLSAQTVHIEVPVRVTQLGSYSYSTNTVNGVAFSAAGTFVNLGPQTISLYPTSASFPSAGTYDYSVTIAPTTASSTGITCSVPVSFISRATATMKIVNVAGLQNTNLTNSNYAAGRVYNWLTGGTYTANGYPVAAQTALYYSGTAAIQIVNVSVNSQAALQNALKDASVVYVGANEDINAGFANLIKEWNQSTGGFVINYADKVKESGLADVLNFYVENGYSSNGFTVNTGNFPQIFSGDVPYLVSDGLNVGYEGSYAGEISTNKGGNFINVSGINTGAVDLTRNIFIFGDKFGDGTTGNNQNFARVLFNVMAYSIRNAPIY